MTYVAADDYLNARGRLGFIITQSVFKTSGAGQGFRGFVLGTGTPVAVLCVDDLTDVQPFLGASNRAAVVVLQRGRPTRYPVPYNLWRKTAKGERVPEDATLAEALEMCRVRQLVAEPVDAADQTSPWITGRPQALKAARKVLGNSEYVARAGAYTGGANGVFGWTLSPGVWTDRW